MFRRIAPRPALAAALACAALASGCAVMKTPYSRDGFYVGASAIGYNSLFDDVEGTDLDDSDGAGGLGLRAGYRFLDRFAAEISYEAGQEFEFSGGTDVSLSNFSASGKFFPVTGRVQPYALAGVGVANGEVDGTTVDESEPLWRVGVGVEGYINRYVPLFFELGYVAPTSDLDDLSFVSAQVGALIRF